MSLHRPPGVGPVRGCRGWPGRVTLGPCPPWWHCQPRCGMSVPCHLRVPCSPSCRGVMQGLCHEGTALSVLVPIRHLFHLLFPHLRPWGALAGAGVGVPLSCGICQKSLSQFVLVAVSWGNWEPRVWLDVSLSGCTSVCLFRGDRAGFHAQWQCGVSVPQHPSVPHMPVPAAPYGDVPMSVPVLGWHQGNVIARGSHVGSQPCPHTGDTVNRCCPRSAPPLAPPFPRDACAL